jgi:PadR family transcriptional regulator PadR
MAPGDASNAVTQLRRGVLEYCVLALLRNGRCYGVELIRRLGEVEVMVTSEGTIYPLLSRLRRDRLVETSWQESPSGGPRRYYQLTAAGHRALDDFAGQWAAFRAAVDHFIDLPANGQREGI